MENTVICRLQKRHRERFPINRFLRIPYGVCFLIIAISYCLVSKSIRDGILDKLACGIVSQSEAAYNDRCKISIKADFLTKNSVITFFTSHGWIPVFYIREFFVNIGILIDEFAIIASLNIFGRHLLRRIRRIMSDIGAPLQTQSTQNK